MKISMSRFQIHDDLTAPEGSVPVLRGALATGGQLPNFLGVLAGSPAALRAYARFRSELRHGKLTLATLERIALAVAEYYQSEPGIAMHSRTARAAGLALDEVALARQFNSKDPSEAALLRYLKALLEERGRAPMYLHEEAREASLEPSTGTSPATLTIAENASRATAAIASSSCSSSQPASRASSWRCIGARPRSSSRAFR